MAGKARWKEFSDFPKYKQAYIKAFERMLETRKKGKQRHRTEGLKSEGSMFTVVLVRVSIAVINTMTKSSCRRKGFISS